MAYRTVVVEVKIGELCIYTQDRLPVESPRKCVFIAPVLIVAVPPEPLCDKLYSFDNFIVGGFLGAQNVSFVIWGPFQLVITILTCV